LEYKDFMRENLHDKVWAPSKEFMDEEEAFIKSGTASLGEERIKNLVDTAGLYRKNAYTPYSHYDVGAAVLTQGGLIFGGCNSEGANYSTTNHAEGSAIAKANTEGQAKIERKYIRAIAIVHEGDSGPCGECLQRIVEHCDNCLIIVAEPDGNIRKITSLKAIFPYNFNPSHLGL
jgi:cytidine deaminase